MTDGDTARANLTSGLARLNGEDVPGLEFLVLQQVMGWALSEENPGSGYDQSHVSTLVGMLFNGLEGALKAPIAHTPDETPAMAASRERLVSGAHEIAAAGEEGLGLLIGRRLVPWVGGELDRSAGSASTQGAGVWATMLYAVSLGTNPEPDEALLTGFVEGFTAWTTLISRL